MRKFTLEINDFGNAGMLAEGPAVAKILRKLANSVESHGKLNRWVVDDLCVKDLNGNTVGNVEFTELETVQCSTCHKEAAPMPLLPDQVYEADERFICGGCLDDLFYPTHDRS